MNIEFTKEEKIIFLSKLGYGFREISIQWRPEIICYPNEIPWENFSALKSEKDLLNWNLDNIFVREIKVKLLSIWKL
jgi:hypothetical protein